MITFRRRGALPALSGMIGALLLAACSSKHTEIIDVDLQKRFETVEDCFPELFPKVEDLLEVAEAWRLNSSTPVPDPPGLTFAQQGDGSLLVTLVAGDCTYTMTIRFYGPGGAEQDDLPLGTASTLSEAIDLAATELRNRFADSEKFMVGDWTVAGTGVGPPAGGALTGIIGGSTNQNELEELRTTTATPAGGPPPVDDGALTLTGPPQCTLLFRTAGLITDDDPLQEYPDGEVALQLTGPEATVTAKVIFDRTAIARIEVDDVPGHFEYDLETGNLRHVAP